MLLQATDPFPHIILAATTSPRSKCPMSCGPCRLYATCSASAAWSFVSMQATENSKGDCDHTGQGGGLGEGRYALYPEVYTHSTYPGVNQLYPSNQTTTAPCWKPVSWVHGTPISKIFNHNRSYSIYTLLKNKLEQT